MRVVGPRWLPVIPLTAFAYKNLITAAAKLCNTKLRMTELGCGENRNGYEHQQHDQLGNLEGRLGLRGGERFQCRDAAKKLHYKNEHIEIQSDHRADHVGCTPATR